MWRVDRVSFSSHGERDSCFRADFCPHENGRAEISRVQPRRRGLLHGSLSRWVVQFPLLISCFQLEQKKS